MKKYVYFPPWKKQLFVSKELFLQENGIKYIYKPYTLKVRFLWYLWNKLSLIRFFLTCSQKDLPPHTSIAIDALNFHDFKFQINSGTPGPEQKTTMYCYSPTGDEVFVKVGFSELACRLIVNEYQALIKLNCRLGVPRAYDLLDIKGGKVLTMEAKRADKFEGTTIERKIIDYIRQICEIDYWSKDGIFYSMSHGDCCPWNFLQDTKGQIFLIDWELSDNRPVGYDLLTFIFRTEFLLNPGCDVDDLLSSMLPEISSFFKIFQILNVHEHLLAIVDMQIEYASSKSHESLLRNWVNLQNILSK
ncbi:phosphotransferase family protein [Dyadobacter jiangsuensis]